ncbi:hypothetical protein [Glycomyces terrestris]|uniref:SH3 domain-containing protein n=1 Tax=Glycomyces terrestris TaxID=2493553 RepID=A0A426UTZ0_9ACTN|nr:hypothetical protein [Glycomyces terrestris]RRR97448.1 hypothetical protein EIW28_18765 [Glycomyces terrestris]
MVMKKLFTAIGVAAAAFALSLSAASPAAAVPAQAPTPVKSRIESTTAADTVAPASAVEQRTCRARFSENVNHRLRAEAGSAILGSIPAGAWVQTSCTRVAGGEYTACGLSSDFWMEVYWNGNWGHGAWGCVKDWEFTS